MIVEVQETTNKYKNQMTINYQSNTTITSKDG